MLADIAGSIVLAIVQRQQLRVAEDYLGHLAQGGLCRNGLAAQCGAELGKEPRAAEAAAAYLHAVAAGLFHHAAGILGTEDIAIAQHWHASICQMLFEAGDFVPSCFAGVALSGGAAVQGNGGGTGLDGDAPGVEMRMVLVIDAHTHLYRDRDIGALCGLDRSRDDIAKEASLIRQRGTAAAAGHLGNRATKVHIDVVREVFVDDHLRGFIGIFRIYRIDL